eukprot:g10145.t1
MNTKKNDVEDEPNEGASLIEIDEWEKESITPMNSGVEVGAGAAATGGQVGVGAGAGDEETEDEESTENGDKNGTGSANNNNNLSGGAADAGAVDAVNTTGGGQTNPANTVAGQQGVGGNGGLGPSPAAGIVFPPPAQPDEQWPQPQHVHINQMQGLGANTKGAAAHVQHGREYGRGGQAQTAYQQHVQGGFGTGYHQAYGNQHGGRKRSPRRGAQYGQQNNHYQNRQGAQHFAGGGYGYGGGKGWQPK